MTRYIVPVLAVVAMVGLVVTQSIIFFDTPIEVSYLPDGSLSGSSLYFNYNIVYYHVAHAFMLFVAVGVSGVCSIVYLAKRNPKWDDIALASAEVAVAFGAVVLLTGSIWAKAAWDHWWVWENRLTMSLLLWLTLVGYVLVRRFAGATGDRLAAGMAVFGMIGVPFIYTMVKADDSHPQAGANGVAATMPPSMKLALWSSVATFFVWFLVLLIMRVKSARAERELRELREQGLDAGVLIS
jgi:heme exporter protein C